MSIGTLKTILVVVVLTSLVSRKGGDSAAVYGAPSVDSEAEAAGEVGDIEDDTGAPNDNKLTEKLQRWLEEFDSYKQQEQLANEMVADQQMGIDQPGSQRFYSGGIVQTSHKSPQLLEFKKQPNSRFAPLSSSASLLEKAKRFSEFLGGRRKRYSEFLGGKKRYSEFLGGKKRYSEFLGGKKRYSEFLGGKKRFSEFLGGKRSPIREDIAESYRDSLGAQMPSDNKKNV